MDPKALAAVLGLAAPVLAAAAGRIDFQMPPRGSPGDYAIVSIEAKDEDARAELKTLFKRFVDLVARRREEGWEAGLLSGAVLERPDEPLQPARQLEESLRLRERELKALRAVLAKAEEPQEIDELRERVKAKERQYRSVRRANGRSKGLSMDWSDAIWAELRKADAASWAVYDETRSALPRHAAAVACTPPRSHALCLAFDPWKTGEPAVYEYNSWNEGRFDGRVPNEYFVRVLPEPG